MTDTLYPPKAMYSVVIPSKNEENFIGKLLRSIKKQTIQPKEIIVADKSTDRTRIIARRFGAIVVEGQGDGRIGKARNKGADYTTAELLAFFDADVKLPDEKFMENAIGFFRENSLDLAAGYYHPAKKNYKSTIVFFFMNLLKKIDSVLRIGFTAGGGFMLTKRSVFEEAGKFNEDYKVSEDIEFFMRAIKKGYKYALIPQYLIVCTRRFAEVSPWSIIKTIIGGTANIIANVTGAKWFVERRKAFDEMYGETGGDLNGEVDEEQE